MGRKGREVAAILELLKKADFEPRIEHTHLDLSEEFWTNLQKEIVVETVEPPEFCPRCGKPIGDLYFHYLCEDDKNFIIVCSDGVVLIIDKKKRTFMDINYGKVLRALVESLNFQIIDMEDESYYIIGHARMSEEEGKEEEKEEEKKTEFYALLLLNVTSETSIYSLFGKCLKRRLPVLLFTPQANVSKCLEVQSFISAGNLVLVIPIENFLGLERKITNWISEIREIIELENKVVSKIKTSHRKHVVSVSTNPRYLLTLLNQLEILKFEEKGKFDWRLLEDLVALAFSYLFISDFRYGGYKQAGVDVPDNLFIIPDKNGSPEIVGIVDCKSSRQTKWDKELTEKYDNYLGRLRNMKAFGTGRLKKALIFVVFDFHCGNFVDFHERMSEYLEEKEYIIVLPLDSLIILVHTVLSTFFQSELNFAGGRRKISIVFDKKHFEEEMRKKRGKKKKEYEEIFKRYEEKYGEEAPSLLHLNKALILFPEIVIGELRGIMRNKNAYDIFLREYFKEFLDNYEEDNENSQQGYFKEKEK